MSHDIETASENIQEAQRLITKTNDKLQTLDSEIHQNVNNFIEALTLKIKENRRNKVNIKNGIDEVMKFHKKAIEIQKEKLKICKDAYDAVDKEVNDFDKKLQKYWDNKETAKSSDAAIGRLAVLDQRRRKKKHHLRRHKRKPKARESVSTEPVAVADYQADPSEPRYCYCQRVAFGRMVACDGESCEYEWFHFICVGLTEDPEAEWFCDDCKTRLEATKKTPRKTVSKTPRRQHNDSYLSPIKRVINTRKSLSELKKENIETRAVLSPVNSLKTAVKPIKIPNKKHLEIPKTSLISPLKRKARVSSGGNATHNKQVPSSTYSPPTPKRGRNNEIKNLAVSTIKVNLKAVKIPSKSQSPQKQTSSSKTTQTKTISKTPQPLTKTPSTKMIQKTPQNSDRFAVRKLRSSASTSKRSKR